VLVLFLHFDLVQEIDTGRATRGSHGMATFCWTSARRSLCLCAPRPRR